MMRRLDVKPAPLLFCPLSETHARLDHKLLVEFFFFLGGRVSSDRVHTQPTSTDGGQVRLVPRFDELVHKNA